MTVTVPEDSNKHKVQIYEGAPRAKRPRMPPPRISASRGATIPVEGWKCITNHPYVLSIVAKGYRHCLTNPPLLLKTPLGNTPSQEFTEDSGNARANIPNASKETQSQRYLQTLQGSIRTYSWYARLLEGGIQ